MKAVVQRCLTAAVTADGAQAGKINHGLMVLIGVCEGDDNGDADILAEKICALRIFTDENDKMNLSVRDIKGEILCVSNFTLCADIKKGNRPSFIGAMQPDEANKMYEYFCQKTEGLGVHTEKGVFGADMKIDMVCDGPITITYDSKMWRKE